MPTTHLLSTKAKKMAAVVRTLHPAVHWWCPQLPPAVLEFLDLA
ncbi:MAG: hypothetical protein ACKVOT_01405 [Polaromonas sp.]